MTAQSWPMSSLILSFHFLSLSQDHHLNKSIQAHSQTEIAHENKSRAHIVQGNSVGKEWETVRNAAALHLLKSLQMELTDMAVTSWWTSLRQLDTLTHNPPKHNLHTVITSPSASLPHDTCWDYCTLLVVSPRELKSTHGTESKDVGASERQPQKISHPLISISPSTLITCFIFLQVPCLQSDIFGCHLSLLSDLP